MLRYTLGKGLLIVLMCLELGPVYRVFPVAFKISLFGGECIVHTGAGGGGVWPAGTQPSLRDPPLLTALSRSPSGGWM